MESSYLGYLYFLLLITDQARITDIQPAIVNRLMLVCGRSPTAEEFKLVGISEVMAPAIIKADIIMASTIRLITLSSFFRR